MFSIDDDNNITLTRGDNCQIEIVIKDSEGVAGTFEDGDIVYFTVKSSTGTKIKMIQKTISEFTDNEAIVYITPSDTKKLGYGTYKYDIQLVDADETVQTICLADFIISDEVTWDGI